jgi:hypothetical protein
MLKISEALIQFDEEPAGNAEKKVVESSDRILRQFRLGQERKNEADEIAPRRD